MSTTSRIEAALRAGLAPDALVIEDESALHAGHRQAGGGGHYRVHVVSASFAGLTLVQRHRLVYDLLRDELKGAVHALALDTRAPGE